MRFSKPFSFCLSGRFITKAKQFFHPYRARKASPVGQRIPVDVSLRGGEGCQGLSVAQGSGNLKAIRRRHLHCGGQWGDQHLSLGRRRWKSGRVQNTGKKKGFFLSSCSLLQWIWETSFWCSSWFWVKRPDSESWWNALPYESIRCGIKVFFTLKLEKVTA